VRNTNSIANTDRHRYTDCNANAHTYTYTYTKGYPNAETPSHSATSAIADCSRRR
jgi:hypothetical protein